MTATDLLTVYRQAREREADQHLPADVRERSAGTARLAPRVG